MSSTHHFFATAAKGLEPLLADELTALGASEVDPTRAGVAFQGSMEVGYRVCLWTRTASRVLLPIATVGAATDTHLYEAVTALPWGDHLGLQSTLAVEATATHAAIPNSHYAMLRIKDAIVDRLRQRGPRPNIDTEAPDVRVNVHLRGEEAIVSIDLSGDGLHRRGYRIEAGMAPLRETLAAALLLRAGWPAAAAEGKPFVDPMCGAGTLPIEAAFMATDCAPGLGRTYWGFNGWRGFDKGLWRRLHRAAAERARAGREHAPRIVGFDADREVVRRAIGNVERAGLRGIVHIERREMNTASAPKGTDGGVLVTNPPYGERLAASTRELQRLYATLGARLKAGFSGWTAYVVTSEERLGKSLGLRATKRHRFYNGAIPVHLLHLPIHEATPEREEATAKARVAADAGRESFVNRLRKNHKRLAKWAKREGIECYRVYDADIPEYAVAIDIYGDAAVVAEYAPPRDVPLSRAAARIEDVRAVLPEVLGFPERQIHFKTRERQRGSAQYDRLSEQSITRVVEEAGLRFEVNLSDYLDTGLFLDHRPTRAMIRELADGKHFLNLFCYTGSASVYAAAGGAATTTSVDMSKTYLNWAHRNLKLNSFTGSRHQLVQANCLSWLERDSGKYDLVFLDPPTFSTSKRMEGTFDIKRDHVALLHAVSRRLAPGGTLIFSTNAQRFRLAKDTLPELQVEEISDATLPKDFARNKRIHRCFRIVSAGT